MQCLDRSSRERATRSTANVKVKREDKALASLHCLRGCVFHLPSSCLKMFVLCFFPLFNVNIQSFRGHPIHIGSSPKWKPQRTFWREMILFRWVRYRILRSNCLLGGRERHNIWSECSYNSKLSTLQKMTCCNQGEPRRVLYWNISSLCRCSKSRSVTMKRTLLSSIF